jgi:hypothetical protein
MGPAPCTPPFECSVLLGHITAGACLGPNMSCVSVGMDCLCSGEPHKPSLLCVSRTSSPTFIPIMILAPAYVLVDRSGSLYLACVSHWGAYCSDLVSAVSDHYTVRGISPPMGV